MKLDSIKSMKFTSLSWSQLLRPARLYPPSESPGRAADTEKSPVVHGDDREKGQHEDQLRKHQRRIATLVILGVWCGCLLAIVLAHKWLLHHAGVAVWVLSMLAVPVCHAAVQVIRHRRAHASGRGAKEAREKARAPLPSLMTRGRGWADAFLYRDSLTWRRVQWGVTVLSLILSITVPLSVNPMTWNGWLIPSLSLVPPVMWWAVVGGRQRSLTRVRRDAAESIRRIAAATLHYPKSKGAAMPLSYWLDLTTGHRAVKVSEWDTTESGAPVVPRVFEVIAPGDLSVTDDKAWSEFEANLGAKVPRESGWHVARKKNGTGAVISPAHYPLSAVWDGEVDHDDVMSFFLGVSLDRQGTMQRLNMVNPSNHALVVGATGAGKTTVIETVVAQVVLKTMPWDRTLRGTAHLIDPKGTLASRWAGRPNIICSMGNSDGSNSDGDTISGFEVMAAHCDLIAEEHKRRNEILAKHPNCATWVDLPDEVKAAEKLAPMLVVLDEFLDHTDVDDVKGSPQEQEQAERDNRARAHVLQMTGHWERKARNVGIHVIIIAQEAKMTDIGSSRVRNAVVRIMAGKLDDVACKGMFGISGSDMPYMPTTHDVKKSDGRIEPDPIPGRCFVQMATGQSVSRFQGFYFGGRQNTDTLDKWLPRSPTPGVGVYGGDSARVQIAAMPDLNDNGIPDAWEAAPDDSPADDDSTSTGIDPSVFPAAHDGVAPASPRAPHCAYEGCDNPSYAECPRGGKRYCRQHVGPSPDPDEAGQFGWDYIESHPLSIAEAEDLYRRVKQEALEAGLTCMWAPVADVDGHLTGQVQIKVTTSEDKLVGVVVASAQGVHARTAIERSGVWGVEAAVAALGAAISARAGAGR